MAQQINQFYLEAFNHALVVVGIVFGLVGIVVPAGIAFFQARQARFELEQLRRQISAEVTSAVTAEKQAMLETQAKALDAFQERSDKVVADLRQEINLELAKNRGGAFHVQALAQSQAGNFAGAVKSACDAIPHFVQGKDFENLRTVCAKLAIPNLKKFNADGLGQAKSLVAKSCEAAIQAMDEANQNGVMADLVRDLRYEWNECLERVAKSDDEGK